MDAHTSPQFVEVVLSKRNLDTLVGLYQLYEAGEGLPALHRNVGGLMVSVIVQPDEIHYQDREPGVDSIILKALDTHKEGTTAI